MDNSNLLSQNGEYSSDTEKLKSNSDAKLNDSDDIFEEASNNLNTLLETNQSTERHPTCQFKSDKPWVDCQYHDLECTSIKKPDEIEKEMEDPPINYDEKILDRIQGSIFGMALGDALGAHVEFRPREYLSQNPVEDLQGGGTWGLQKGQFTDDTSMALCLANSLIARREFNPYDQLVRYHWWHIHGYMSSTGQCFDIGSATRQSLQEFAHRQKIFSEENNIPIKDLDFLEDLDLIHKFNVYCSQDGVAGNGALMRLAPVPLFFYKDPVRAVEFSGISGKITHGDQKAYDACRYYGALIVAALNGEPKEQLLDKDFYLKHIYWFNEETLHTDIMNISQGSYQKQGGYDDGIRGKGYIVDALEAALWAFWSDENSFKKGALTAVNLGDDTDTTAAIYGQLAGAYYGYHNLPSEWLEHVYAKKFIDVLCKWIAYEGQRQKTSTDAKPHDDHEATPPTTPIDTKPHDDQEATPPTTPTDAKPQDDQKATPPTTPTIAISQNNQKITPPTTPIDIKPHSDQEAPPPTTPTDAKPQEDQKATPPTTPTVAISQNDQEITPPTTPQNNLTTVLSSSETLHSDLHTTYKHTEASEFSAKKFDRIPTDEPPYEYESYRSDPTYYSSSISKESPPILKTVETRSDTRTRNVWENIVDNRPFSSESTSYASPTNKPTNLNKNLLSWSINDVCQWIQSFGQNYSTYTNSFRKDFIDGFRLYNFINDNVLIEYGVQNKDHRQSILDAIQDIRRDFLQKRSLHYGGDVQDLVSKTEKEPSCYDLGKALENLFRIPINDQLVYYRGKRLHKNQSSDDDHPLSRYGIFSGNTVTLIGKRGLL